jgi:hypothetical protein
MERLEMAYEFCGYDEIKLLEIAKLNFVWESQGLA